MTKVFFVVNLCDLEDDKQDEEVVNDTSPLQADALSSLCACPMGGMHPPMTSVLNLLTCSPNKGSSNQSIKGVPCGTNQEIFCSIHENDEITMDQKRRATLM